MKTILGIIFAVVVYLAFGVTDASAQRRSIDSRQVRQQTRINNGAGNGSVTKREYVRLENQQNRIATREAYMRSSGGVFTVRERARLQHSQNRASRNIFRQAHDRQVYPIP